ncbi:DUF6869 domain-containing protein [Ruegeria arenilitoris]|uniref:DUF6869 domain-containing protein n=1 Tax=Ruegeria arenilitoris TaxID=1173585 RepID=UPI001C2C1513|nr:hypothetical protein [Ruegeria arenilitoris]
MARFWLEAESQYDHLNSTKERLVRFAQDKGLDVGQTTLKNVTTHLDGNQINGDPARWVTFFCFWYHPRALWDFMMNALEVAETDDHYQAIATSLAEHILAHYGSVIPHFEGLAQKDDSFARMLTGVWRHRMSDDVWMRLRVIQSRVDDPLPTLIPIENGVEYMAENLSEFDRMTANKGRYLPDENGAWRHRSELNGRDAGCD